MNKNIFTIERYNNYTFYFKHEPELPELLHIYVRHLTNTTDAISTFFLGTVRWNKKRNRFETTSNSHCLYWTWLDEKNLKILIITCFTI